MTLSQKILLAHAIGWQKPWVATGDVLQIRVDWTLASELSWNGMDQTYTQLGRPRVLYPHRFFLAVDHTVDPTTLAGDPRTQRLVNLSRSFAQEQNIKHFYDANQTILHTKFYRDLVLPGDVVLGADSHTTSHGGLGAFAIGLGGADVVAAMVLGQSWIEVPEAIAVEYVGVPPRGLGGKDIILKTLGELGRNAVALERTVEYQGDACRHFSTDVRFTIANMTAELGGLNGIFTADGVATDWIGHRNADGIRDGARYFCADEGAPYIARTRIDLDALAPQIARPFSPDNVVNIDQEVGHPLDGVFIGACTTTEEELVLAGLLLEAAFKGSVTPVPHTNRLVVPGDLSIHRRLADAGVWTAYHNAGFTIDPPGCSMCLGVASRKAGEGETWLSSQNRNFPNRMGQGSLAYLASAATTAASSLSMTIRDPREYFDRIDWNRWELILGRDHTKPLPVIAPSEPVLAVDDQSLISSATSVPIATSSPTSPRTFRGHVQRFGDNVDTDQIIPGPFCHLTSLKELGEKCFHFVRPDFVARVRHGQNIVVAGEAWGAGSSREQAVWALKGAGIQAVIAKSFAFIHKRNLVNEAMPFLVLNDPRFYELATDDAAIEVDLERSTVLVAHQTFVAEPPGPMVLAIQQAGGLVAAITAKLC